MHTLPRIVLPLITLEGGYDKVRIPQSRGFGLIRPASTHHRSARKKSRRGTGLRVFSPSRLRRHHDVRGWPAIPKARRYSHLRRDRQNFTSRHPSVPVSSYPIKGQIRALQGRQGARCQDRSQVLASKGTQPRDQHLKQSPLYSFISFEIWAWCPLS
jgi:hypothetical protein